MSDKKSDDVMESLERFGDVLSGFDDAFREIDGDFESTTDRIARIDAKFPSIEPPKPPLIVEDKSEPSLKDGPDIQFIDVVLRDELQTDNPECKPSAKHDGLELCEVGDTVTKYRYDPDTFSRATGAKLVKLQDKIKKCPLCQVKPEEKE